MKDMVSFYKENIQKFKNEKPIFNIYIEEVCTEGPRELPVVELLKEAKETVSEKKDRSYTFSASTNSNYSNAKSHYSQVNELLNDANFVLPKNNPLQGINK